MCGKSDEFTKKLLKIAISKNSVSKYTGFSEW